MEKKIQQQLLYVTLHIRLVTSSWSNIPPERKTSIVLTNASVRILDGGGVDVNRILTFDISDDIVDDIWLEMDTLLTNLLMFILV